jgi:nucleoside-diphosphate-sugar epimerase
MRCLVTGASGFLGSWLVRQLMQEGHQVLAVVRPGVANPRLSAVASHLEFAYADLATISTLSARAKEFMPDVVYHLAWSGANTKTLVNDPEQIYTNVPATLELVRIAAEAQCKTFLFAGTSVEYGTYQVPVLETDAVAPRNLYGHAKHAMMQLTEALSTTWGMRFCGVRPFWTYGPMDDRLRMIPSVIDQLLEGERPKVTQGEQRWDFLYVQDAVRALSLLAANGGAEGIFNLGSGDARPIREVITSIRDMIDPRLEIGFGEIPYAPNQVMHLEANVDKLKKATGWAPKTSLEEGLGLTIDWHRQQSRRASFHSSVCAA